MNNAWHVYMLKLSLNSPVYLDCDCFALVALYCICDSRAASVGHLKSGWLWVRVPPEAAFSSKNTAFGELCLSFCCVALPLFLGISWMINIMYGSVQH